MAKQIKIVGCDLNICPCRKCVVTKKCYECDNERCPNLSKKVCTVKTIDEWRKDVLIEETRAHRAKVAQEKVERENETVMMFG